MKGNNSVRNANREHDILIIQQFGDMLVDVKGDSSIKMAAPMARSKMHFMKEQMSAAVGNSSVVVKIIACAVIIGYFLSFITSAIPFMTVTPGYVMPPNARVYSFFMYCFVELHFWHVLADIAVVVLCGKLLEPLWGAPDMLLFFVVVNLGVGVMTAIFYVGAYLVTLNEDYLFDVHIYGLAGYIAGFCVAVKQVMPDHCVATMPFGKLRNTHIPLSLLLITILLRVLGALPGPYPYMFGWGIVISWVYLRFYQKHTNGNRGDMGDNFSFARYCKAPHPPTHPQTPAPGFLCHQQSSPCSPPLSPPTSPPSCIYTHCCILFVGF